MSYGMQKPPYYAQGAPPPQNVQAAGYYQQSSYPPPTNGGYDSYKPPNGGPAGMPLAPDGYQGERFQPAKKRFRDPVFALLFLIVFGGFTGLSVYCLRDYSISNVSGGIGADTGFGTTLNQHTAILLTLSCGVALVFSALYLVLVRVATRFILEITLFLSVVFNIGYCIYLWTQGNTSAAIVFTIFAVLSIISYFFMRSRIPLTRLLLRTAIRATKTYPSVYLWALIGLLVQTCFSIWTAWTLIAVYQRFSPSGSARGSHSSSGAVTGLVVFVVVAYYWISEMLKAIFFATNSAIFGTYYYSIDGSKQRGAGIKAFGRATTYSLGSLSFGSLILAILDLIRGLISIVQSSAAQDGDMIGYAISCCLGLVVGCIDWLITFFNRYAYINIAVYGNSFVQAAKETWRLMKDRGIDALAADSLCDIVWTFGSLIVGIITGLFTYIYIKQTDPPEFDSNSNYFAVVLFFAIGMGIQICLTLGSGAIGSGVSTFFVALAEDPQIMAQKDPQLFELIRQKYPRVVNAV